MRRRVITAVALGTLGLAVFAPRAPAPVPPKDCGFLKVDGQRYNVKSDQVRCKPAKKLARAYLADGKRPKGYQCTNYGPETQIEFRCTKGVRVIFAIRR